MKIIKLVIIALALNLTACAQLQQVTDGFKKTVSAVVSPDNFDTITIAYAGVSAAGNTYYSLCERKTINKSCWKIIAKLQPYEDQAFKSYMALNTFVKSNPSADASSFIQLARNAIDVLQGIQLQNGVK